ncbi:MAG: snoRNA-binding rRNA-processing protein utp10 [Thelocarpon impressellum]|nr:MAG: snoRNA-binding rRNA-processing protein utp10 [Thelocarpon impressellum]
MATTLAAQLSQVAAKSTNALNLKAQKIAHSKSLIFDATVAASQDFDTLYTVCAEGFQELCLLDPRFKPFTRSIFSEHSKAEDRTQMTQRENEELDRALEDFLGLLGGRLLLKPAVKAIEWLVRRFRVHEYNTAFLLLTFLPYHTAPIFTTLLSVLPPEIPPTFKFLHPYIRSLTNPARHAVVYAAINSQAFATALNSHVISLCRSRHHHHAVLSFWAGIMTEAVSGMLDRARSGRSTVQRQAEEDVLLRILPVLNEGLAMKKVPELRLGCYMILTVLAAKADLEGRVLNGMMEAVVGGWNMDTLDAGLTCLAILAQTRDSTRLPPSIVKGVLKIEGLSGYLIALHQRYRVDKLALALALGAVTRLGRAGVAQTCAFLESTLTSQILSDSQRAVTLKSLFLEAQTLDLGVNGGTSTGRELADLLVRLSAAPTLTEPMRKAIEQSGVEVDLLEMKLQTVIRSSQPTIDGPAVDSEMHDIAPTNGFQGQVETLLVILRERSVEDPSFLSHKASAVFGPLSETFIASASTPAHLVEVLDLPVLCKERALDESLFYSFFMRICLLRGLFQTLGDLQRLKVHVGSELAYLHGLLLDSLLKIIDGYKDSEDLTLDRAAIRADLLVDSIRSTGNPQVQIAALLLVASLADVAPDLVLHSVMPIFTFMGPTVLRQDDEFSVHVINQAIKQVIPPLVGSLRKQNQDPVAGTAELLLSFVAAYEHIPSHRRLELFTSLVRTLGEQDFLFALLAMLADRYANDAEVQVFTATLTAQFSPETLLSTARKCMDLAIDAMRSQRSLSGILLSIGQTEHGTPVTAASNVLRLVKEILSAKRLVSRIGDAAEQQKGGPLVSTENFSTLLEHLLDFASGVKSERELYAACGEVLESLLHLLPTPDFIQSIETLLERPDEKLRCKALKAFEIRLRSEKQGEKSAAASILAFLPRVASIIEGPSSMVLKHSAISCVDHILERYGKKDIDAVAAAAHTIAGPHGLRHDDDRLRVLSLLCLTSCVEILQAGIIPLLPHTVPQALGYLAASLEEGSGNEKIHDAVFSFLGAFLLYVPWMITGTHLDDILRLCHKSAQARLGEVADESRLQVLRLIPNHLDVKDCFGALDRNWSSAIETGPTALKEHLDVLGIAVERHPKAAIVKHAQVLGSILLKILDLRRTIASDGADAFATMEVVEVEKVANDVAINIILKMNDTTFRPIFSQVIERAGGRQSKKDTRTRTLRLTSLYTFLYTFFDTLKSIVTSYSSYVIDLAIEVLDNVRPRDKDAKALWTVVTRTLSKSFEHDRDDFWQSPSHFGAVAPTLLSQLGKASFLPVAEVVIPAITELAAAVDSGEQHKELNAAILKHLRSPDAQVRLAAVLCEEALTDRLGEEWLALLPEMLPFISELQEDDDEGVERQTHRWIVKMEGVLGESLESMLQ